MKHVIVGGDGFVGRHLAEALLDRGEEVVVASLRQSALAIYPRARFVPIDVTRPETLAALPVEPDDVVYHLAARMLMPIMPRHERREYFFSVNHRGTENLIRLLEARGCTRLVYFTTDMVYGHTRAVPKTEDHPRQPLGPYGASKLASEQLCEACRRRGMRITILRPRLIIGPGRLGILARLFQLVEHHLPVPVIGNGRNHYQFVSVFDCARAALCAVDRGLPNAAYNLGSGDPPTVNDLLRRLIAAARSRSFLVHVPAAIVKPGLALLDRLGWPLMDPEQYLIADEDCIVDVGRAERDLGWRPRFRDDDMLLAAFEEYRKSKGRPTAEGAAAMPPA